MTKVYNVWAIKSTEKLCLMALKIDTKFKGKLACAFKNDMRNLANLHRLKWMNSAFNKPFCTCLTGPLFFVLGPHCWTLLKKAFLSPSVWARREYIWKLNRKESLLICFENCHGVTCSYRQSSNRIMNTFIIVNINLICKRKFRGSIYVCPL